jgi:hypothetical protein
VIEQAPWAGDDDLRLPTKLRHLTTVRHATVDRDALQTSSWSELLDHIIDLLSELTGRSENESLGPLLFRSAELLKDWKNERGRFSGSCLRESDKIPALDDERDCLCLNWGWSGVADRFYRLLKKRSQRKIIKGKRADLFRS